MKRRALLSMAACSSFAGAAGCLDRQSGQNGGGDTCDDALIEQATVRVEYDCYTGSGQASTIVARADGCNGELTVEMAQNGEVLLQRIESSDSGQWSFRIETENTVLNPGTAGVRLLDGRDVLAERTVDVDHWADAPDLRISQMQVTPERVAVGEPVTAEFVISIVGASASFAVEILADGETFWERTGSVDEDYDCVPSGPRYTVDRVFDEPGEYEIAGRITVDDTDVEDAGDHVVFGTVTVESET